MHAHNLNMHTVLHVTNIEWSTLSCVREGASLDYKRARGEDVCGHKHHKTPTGGQRYMGETSKLVRFESLLFLYFRGGEVYV